MYVRLVYAACHTQFLELRNEEFSMKTWFIGLAAFLLMSVPALAQKSILTGGEQCLVARLEYFSFRLE
jgi:hypothetical protein